MTSRYLALEQMPGTGKSNRTLFNNATRILDAAAGLKLVSRTTTATPASPTAGDAWLVPGSGVTGQWAGHEDEIAVAGASGWDFRAPWRGPHWYVADEDVWITWDDAPSTPIWLEVQYPRARGVRLAKNATQSISASTPTDLTWQTEDIDTDAAHPPGGSPATTEKIAAPVDVAYASIVASCEFAADATALRRISIQINATEVAFQELPAAASGTTTVQTATGLIGIAPDDEITVKVEQTTAGAINAVNSARTFVAVAWHR